LRVEDAARVAELNAQLGYSADHDAIRDRLRRIACEPGHTALGAEGPNGLVGFVHFFERPSLEKGFDLVVQSLVADEKQRNRGVGRLLMSEVEKAAHAKGVRSIALSSRIDRQDAHAFYRRLGYEVVATSSVFFKTV
jgi:ribosomal protein S18 acetylase RimI-like enzyme